MRTFVLVMFWACILHMLVRSCYVVGNKYPRIEEKTAAMDLLSAVINVATAMWAAYVLWG